MLFAMLLPIVHSILDTLGSATAFGIPLFIVLVIIGLIVIILIKLFIVLIPAIIVAIIVYFLTAGNLFWAGLAFLIVALLSLVRKI